MVSMVLESGSDTLDLASVEKTGQGVQLLRGVTGLGLPPVQQQYLEGAGDGGRRRGKRVLMRDIDLPLLVQGEDGDGLEQWLSRLATILEDDATLTWIDRNGNPWSTRVARVGGGDYTYGEDTVGEQGACDIRMVITVRAEDPYFTRKQVSTQTLAPAASKGLLTGSLSALQLTGSQALGTITLHNPGDVKAYPVWTIYGPGNNFKAVSPSGEVLWWQGSLSTGDVLTIDTRPGAGTAIDQTGTNRFDSFAAAPRMWAIPKGESEATVTMLDITPGVSKIVCSWQPRRWAVI
jgi:hypothetical protein